MVSIVRLFETAGDGHVVTRTNSNVEFAGKIYPLKIAWLLRNTKSVPKIITYIYTAIRFYIFRKLNVRNRVR